MSPTSKVPPQNRGKVPGYRKNDGTWIGRGGAGALTDGETTRDELKKWAADGAGIGILGRGFPGLDNDASNERIRDGLREIIHKHVGVGPRRGRDNSLRDLHMLVGPRLKPWDIAYRPPRKPAGDKNDHFEFKATGTYYNVEGLHPSGARYSWAKETGHPCDCGPLGLPMIDQEISDAIYADAVAFLRAEGCEIVEGRGPSGGGANDNGTRIGLDDDPSRHDEPGTLRFMDLCPNDAKRNARRNDVVRELAAIKTALGPNREDNRGKARDWFMHPDFPDNTEEEFDKIWDSIEKSIHGVAYLRSRCPELRNEHAQEVFADPVPDDSMNTPDPQDTAGQAMFDRYAYVRDPDVL